MHLPDSLSPLLLVYLSYVIAVASPGPSNMAIMGVAMGQGRRAGLALATGVLTGSYIWALAAAAGLSALLTAWAGALVLLKIAGGLYLLWLAVKSARAAARPDPGPSTPAAPVPLGRLYRRGVLLHLTNPKAVLGWMAIMSLGLAPASGTPAQLPAILGGCALLGVVIFPGYALLFSTAPMVRGYRQARRWIEGLMAAVFGAAGLRLLLSRP